jgi:hypothetical protein
VSVMSGWNWLRIVCDRGLWCRDVKPSGSATTELWCIGVDWVQLARDRVQWQALADMNLLVP